MVLVFTQTASSGGIITTASLERVMDGLGESEKYNAVLQGVSSLLMGKKKAGDAATVAFEEVFQLLDEMHANRIKCTIRTASAVIDAATATTNIGIIAQGEACRVVFGSAAVWIRYSLTILLLKPLILRPKSQNSSLVSSVVYSYGVPRSK